MNPVDITLEQTINADAASRLTGISSFKQSIAAKKSRWTITRSARNAVRGSLLTKAGLKSDEQDTHKELRPSRVERDNVYLKKIVERIYASFNPFIGGKVIYPYTLLYCIREGSNRAS